MGLLCTNSILLKVRYEIDIDETIETIGFSRDVILFFFLLFKLLKIIRNANATSGKSPSTRSIIINMQQKNINRGKTKNKLWDY